ncbi:M48 family metalloprotease [Paenibacillus taichungensis]|uniref:M48 family metalloprotease n=1 Tax=Paenibacillus taichungensis TaxID=484184 RepID=UPI0039A1EB8C
MFTGRVEDESTIYLTDSLISNYYVDPLPFRYVLGHELVHIKYNDFGKRIVWLGFKTVFSNVKRAESLLIETRADMLSYKYNDFSFVEVKGVLTTLKKNEKGKEKSRTYKQGYPSRSLLIEAMREYKDFSPEFIDYILEDFCSFQNVFKNTRNKINDLKKQFK